MCVYDDVYYTQYSHSLCIYEKYLRVILSFWETFYPKKIFQPKYDIYFMYNQVRRKYNLFKNIDDIENKQHEFSNVLG